MEKEDVGQTQIWKINDRMVVAQSVESALAIWRAYHKPSEPEICNIEHITQKGIGALILQGVAATLAPMMTPAVLSSAPYTTSHPVAPAPANGVYPEEDGVRIWKDGHTFLVPKDWNKGEWPLLNDEGYERSKKNKERLMTEVEALLDWDFVADTKHIQELGTDIPLKEGEYMITAPVHLAMYEYRHELNQALRAMGAEEINFDEDCWFAQRYSANFAWFFGATGGTLYYGNHVFVTYQVRAVSL